jgi:gamma-glutamyltranspeptidase
LLLAQGAADAHLRRRRIRAGLSGRSRRSLRGWLAQTRSEVMARNGIVSTVQPLAAQAGLRILQQGGNAIDAAVATAAMLNVVFPQNVGIGGDLFALIYVAKEKKVYQLNASGIAPAGLTLARLNSLGYKVNTRTSVPDRECRQAAFSRSRFQARCGDGRRC